MGRLKVALLGLVGDGEHYRRAIERDDLFELIAISDPDVNLLRDISERTGVRGFEDYRSLIVELSHEGLDALFIALEPHTSYEFVQMAAQAKIAVFHKPPFCRNMGEGRMLIDLFQAAGRPLVIARTWLSDAVQSMKMTLSEEVGHVQLAMAEMASVGNADGWRGDGVRAGGGVLLHGAYPQLDLLISVMGIPEEAFAQCAMFGRAGGIHKYDTEDMVTLCLRFSAHRSATLTAYRHAPQPESRIRWVGSHGVVETTSTSLVAQSGDRAVDVVEAQVVVDAGISRATHEFGEALSCGTKQLSTGQDHLVTVAVLEAAYLSSRTGAPESVGRFLSVD